MIMSRPTPETDAFQASGKAHYMACEFARRLERERDEAREESKMWKANHDNQVKLKSALMDRHDLGDRARKVVALAKERDEARELARELRDALRLTLTSLIGRMVPKDTDTVECAHAAITKAKEVLL